MCGWTGFPVKPGYREQKATELSCVAVSFSIENIYMVCFDAKFNLAVPFLFFHLFYSVVCQYNKMAVQSLIFRPFSYVFSVL